MIAPGVMSTFIVALAATYLSDHHSRAAHHFRSPARHGIERLVSRGALPAGHQCFQSARVLLRISVARLLFGLRITFGQIAAASAGRLRRWWSRASPLTICVGWLLAKILKVDGRFGTCCPGGAVGICGASAATGHCSGVASARGFRTRHQVMVIACITTYSTIAMLLYPALLS